MTKTVEITTKQLQELAAIKQYLEDLGMHKSAARLQKEVRKATGLQLTDSLSVKLEQLMGVYWQAQTLNETKEKESSSSSSSDEDSDEDVDDSKKVAVDPDPVSPYEPSTELIKRRLSFVDEVKALETSPVTETKRQRFQRVKEEEVKFKDFKLKDNSFEAKGGSHEQSYGYNANQIMQVTRGKSFTKAKNKMKKGSYRGGQIDQQSHSIKFTSDSE